MEPEQRGWPNPPKVVITREQMVMAVLRSYIHSHGHPPSYRDIIEADIPGITSTSTVSRILHKLKAHGYIDFKPGFPRTLRILDSLDETGASVDI